MHYNTAIEIDGIERAIVVICHIHKGRPGRTYGEPYLCYEAEPAWVEIECVRDGKSDITDDLKEKQLEIEDYLMEYEAADKCDYADYLADSK